jgi:hypothetical protein
MQVPVPTVQQPPAAAPQAPTGTPIAAPQAPALPLTASQVAAIRAQRQELSDQLESANGRRSTIARQLQSATGANRAGLEQRLGVLDQRIAQLETDMATTGRQLTSSPGALVRTSTQPPWVQAITNNAAPLDGAFILFVLAPIAIGFGRWLWRQSSGPRAPGTSPSTSPDTTQRLQRIEHAVDAIAIEVERVSENQRFLTRVLTERGEGIGGRNQGEAARADGAPLALGAGSAPFEPLRVDQREMVPASPPRG